MKNVSKLALFVAAGMLSAGANAANLEIGDDTTMTLDGSYTLNYFVRDSVDTSNNNENNQDEVDAKAEFDLEAARDFDGFTAYVEVGLEWDSAPAGSDIDQDGTVAGLEGDFGQIEFGDSDNVYEDLITDATDPFEDAGFDSASLTAEESMLTYYSPDLNGFSFNLQSHLQDETDQNDTSNGEQSLHASAAYDFGLGSLHVGYDDKGLESTGDAEVLGFAAAFSVGNSAEVGLKHETETSTSGVDTDYSAIALTVNYGAGDVYGGYQNVSEDGGSDKSQFAVGINAEIADDLSTYAEYGSFDGQSATAADTIMAVGLVFDF
jgi:predicted porin